MGHSKHTSLRPNELNSETADGANVYGPEDSHIGDVSHFHETGQTAQAVVDACGFLGFGAKPVFLPVSSLYFMRDENAKVHSTTVSAKRNLCPHFFLREQPYHKS